MSNTIAEYKAKIDLFRMSIEIEAERLQMSALRLRAPRFHRDHLLKYGGRWLCIRKTCSAIGIGDTPLQAQANLQDRSSIEAVRPMPPIQF